MTHFFRARRGNRSLTIDVRLDAGISRSEARAFLRQSYPEYTILD